MTFHRRALDALATGVSLERIMALPSVAEIGRMKELEAAAMEEKLRALIERIHAAFDALG
jgi:hypothetical protein